MSLWFFESENFATRAAKFADVLELDKKIPDWQYEYSARFRKSHKVLYHSSLSSNVSNFENRKKVLDHSTQQYSREFDFRCHAGPEIKPQFLMNCNRK